MGIRDITERVTAELVQGQSRRDIFNLLVSKDPAAAGKIAYCIASVPEEALRRKYLKQNALLCVLLVLCAVLNMESGLPINPGEPTIFLVLTTTVPIVFSYFVYRFHGGVYRITALWFIVELLEIVLLTGASDGVAVLRLFTLFFIVALSFYLARKVFPHLGLLGPKKDGTGHYQL